MNSFSACILQASPVRDVTRSSPASRRSGDRLLYLSGVLRGGDPVLYVIYFHLCTKIKIICSFNTLCTCIRPYYVQKTYKTTYEFHFQLGFSRRVRSVTSHGVSPHLAGRGSIHYIFRAFSEAETPFCTFYCLFRTEYELISSFNTFCTCFRPYYVQKMYKTTYEFHFQLAFSRRVRSMTSHGVSPYPAVCGSIHYTFRAFSESETPFCT